MPHKPLILVSDDEPLVVRALTREAERLGLGVIADTHSDVLLEAHKLRVARGDYNIAEVHLADAIQALVESSRATLSDDRAPKNPY